MIFVNIICLCKLADIKMLKDFPDKENRLKPVIMTYKTLYLT